jgi:hypothetical protein
MTPRSPLVWILLALVTLGCRHPKPVGQLVVSIHTDMSMPQQIDALRVQVLFRNEIRLSQDYPVGKADGNSIPATLTIVAGKDPTIPVTIRVMGGKSNGVWRTFREVITTVPADRTATVRMPVQWLCDGSAKTTMTTDATGSPAMKIESTCGDGNSCIAGHCVPSPVPEAMLPTYDPKAVFGGAAEPAEGTCFDTVPCMSRGTPIDPNAADCTIARPAGVDALNVALRVPADGICDQEGAICFVPLDANSDEGWKVTPSGDRLALPRAACDRLKSGAATAIYVSSACGTKTESTPPCGEWSKVTGGKSAPAAVDAGAPPVATKVVSLHAATGDGVPCCPLMSDGQRLVTCLCATKATARVVAVNPSNGTTTALADLDVPPTRGSAYLGAAVLDGTLFWADPVANTIERASLLGDGRRLAPLPVNGDVAEAAPILVDRSAIHLLASAVVGAAGAPLQLLSVDRAAGSVRAFDTGSNFHVHQFSQDAAAVYLVSDQDRTTDGGSSVQRQSRVVRIAKADGALTTASEATTIDTADRLRGGYLGTATDLTGGDGVYALYEDAPAADGTVTTRVVRLDATGKASTLLERSLDPSTGLWLLGVIDGTVLLARTESTTTDGGAPGVRSSSVLAIPAHGGAPRILADSARDYPMLGLQAVTYDADWVYWLNSSGDLFRFGRGALQ